MLKKIAIIFSIFISQIHASGPGAGSPYGTAPLGKENVEANVGAGSAAAPLKQVDGENSECPICFEQPNPIFFTACCDKIICQDCGDQIINEDKELIKNLQDPAWRKLNSDKPFPKPKGCPFCREILYILSAESKKISFDLINKSLNDINVKNIKDKIASIHGELNKLHKLHNFFIIKMWLKEYRKVSFYAGQSHNLIMDHFTEEMLLIALENSPSFEDLIWLKRRLRNFWVSDQQKIKDLLASKMNLLKPQDTEKIQKGTKRKAPSDDDLSDTEERPLKRGKHDIGEKPHGCDKCGKKFTKLHHLEIHQRLHNSKKPFPCDTCGKKFAYLKVLKIHKRFHKE